MWFKNLQLYRLSEAFDLDAEALHEKLLQKPARPCAGLDTFTLGWDSPLGRDSQQLTHAVNGCIMVCARREERVLPAAVVREQLDERVAQIESAEGRSVRRQEKQQLRDEILVDLLPRAFSRASRLMAYIDTQQNWVIVDSASAGKAEDLLSLLRETLGSFKVRPFEVKQAPAPILTDWLARHPSQHFELLDECELRDPLEDGGIVRIRGQGLGGSETRTHLDAGKLVSRLAVKFRDHLSAVLVDDVSIKRLKFLEIIQQEASEAEAETREQQFDVNFSLMTLQLREFIEALIAVYGGLNRD